MIIRISTFLTALLFFASCYGQIVTMPGKAYNNLRLYPSTDRCILAGDGPTPTLGYLTFGNQAIAPSTASVPYRLYHIYRQGSDHNITADAYIKVIYSDDGWATHSSPITVISPPGGGVNLTSIDVFVTSTGRVIMFYTKAISSTGIIYYKYSDTPDLSVISSEARFSMDYDSFYLDATGSCVEISGIIYKSCWAVPVGGREVPFYKSTDDGITWTKVSNISTVTDNYDETHIALHPNGTIYAFQRSNDLNLMVVKSTTNLGVTWSSGLVTTVSARGRNGAVITPEGVFCVLTRESIGKGRAKLAQSVNGINWTSDFIDGRQGVYMYGGCVWQPVSKKIIASWSVEAENAVAPGTTGPTIVVAKDIIQSITPISPPTVYDPIYQGLLDFAQANGEALPSTTQQGYDNMLAVTLRGLGTFEKTVGWEDLWIWEYNDTGISDIKLRSWIRPWVTCITTASPTYTTTGFDFNGSTQYISLRNNLNIAGKFSLNSASFVIAYSENVSGSMRDGLSEASFSTISNATLLNPRSGTDLAAYSINDGTTNTVSNTNSIGHFHVQRINSTTKRLWKETTKIDEQTVSSTNVATLPIHVGATVFTDQKNFFSTRTVRYVGYGSKMEGREVEIRNAFNARKTSLGL